ncbi:MAG: hypothetical protein KF901_02175 [Myxococcales bacterium]|nr:hypothetical protein [Myxococcales bacterium]
MEPLTFVDPETHEPLHLADADTLERVRVAASSGRARRADGGALPARFDGAYLTRSGRRAYLVIEGIPHFLVDERLDLEPPVVPETA